jgi:hypothetical protein
MYFVVDAKWRFCYLLWAQGVVGKAALEAGLAVDAARLVALYVLAPSIVCYI